jgi:hypothetical protein
MDAIALSARAGGSLLGLVLPRKDRTQDAETVRLLRLGIGVVGVFLPAGLIAVNWVRHFWQHGPGFVIIPTSMSGSYWTTARDVFVGSLCAIGVFLIGYRRTRVQDLCSTVAGICALLVAFNPTAPGPGMVGEPPWVNYLHHGAAGALLLTLGAFCFVFFAEYRRPHAGTPAAAGPPDTGRPAGVIYLTSGCTVIAAVIAALITGLLGVGSTWPLLYLLEAIAVFSFGAAWITASLHDQPGLLSPLPPGHPGGSQASAPVPAGAAPAA